MKKKTKKNTFFKTTWQVKKTTTWDSAFRAVMQAGYTLAQGLEGL